MMRHESSLRLCPLVKKTQWQEGDSPHCLRVRMCAQIYVDCSYSLEKLQ